MIAFAGAHRMTSNRPTIVLIGNPEHPRVARFCQAARAAGLAAPHVIPWLTLCERGGAALDALDVEHAFVRVDSFGEDSDVTRALLRRGFDAATRHPSSSVLTPREIDALVPDDGRIVAPRQLHQGFLSVLEDLERALRGRPSWRILLPLWATREMFDKRAAVQRIASLGVPVSNAIDPSGSARELRELLRSRGTQEAWIKLTCGSSASCLALWQLGSRSEALVTTTEIAHDGLYNTKRLRRYARRELIDRVVDFILGEGAHVEEGVQKARIDGRFVDLRVLVIADEAAFVVARASRYPITNLHLGSARLEARDVAARCAPNVFATAMDGCRAIARAYGAFQVGIDLAFTRDFSAYRVFEANAFGDDLHRVTRDGLDPYAWQVRALGGLT
jgi:hypothetical protein